MLAIGEEAWEIELTLSNRDEMGFRMLIGREAMRGHFIVDPKLSYRRGRRRTTVVSSAARANSRADEKGSE